MMMRAVSDLTRPYGVANGLEPELDHGGRDGMCGACMVPVTIDGKMVRKHACIDGRSLTRTSSTGTSSCALQCVQDAGRAQSRRTRFGLTRSVRSPVPNPGSLFQAEADLYRSLPVSHGSVLDVARTWMTSNHRRLWSVFDARAIAFFTASSSQCRRPVSSTDL